VLDKGRGIPVVLIPGIQGHWEWMRPAVDALARRCRVITDSLPGERGSLARWNPHAGFDQFVDHVDSVMRASAIDRAIVCGVSFGGLIAVRYAAVRPERVEGLVLVSTPAPRWSWPASYERYVRYPRLSLPLFVARAVGRGRRELQATFPARRERIRFSAVQLPDVLRRPMAPMRAAARMRSIRGRSFEADCRAIAAPVLIVTGERHLDRVVPVDDTLRYAALIPQAEHVELARTGHLGSMTRPDVFADRIASFAARAATRQAAARAR
jgi:pimeloyl-ACP methyl ester carboxylesterase